MAEQLLKMFPILLGTLLKRRKIKARRYQTSPDSSMKSYYHAT